MIRMLIIGCCMGIRSERRLCEEVHLNLAIAGSAVSIWVARCPITRPSRAAGNARRAVTTGTAGSVTAICSESCSR